MDFERIIDVLAISLPVFAMIGLGKILALKGFITENRKTFINELVNTFSLPSLIFINVATQDLEVMWNPSLIAPSLIGVGILIVLFVFINKLCGNRGGFAAACIFGTYWANVAYMGFPMCELAFGGKGVDLAAVYNAYFMIFYIPVSFTFIGIYGADAQNMTAGQRIVKIIKNPIFLAVVFGMLVAFIGDQFRVDSITEDGVAISELTLSPVAMGLLLVAGSLLRMIGGMGLPLALLAIGAAMNIKAITDRIFTLSLVIAGKLLVLPGCALLFGMYLFPDIPKVVLGSGVLLAAMPNAVAGYVIGKQAGVDEGFLSSMLVLSTAISIITIPLWLYIVI